MKGAAHSPSLHVRVSLFVVFSFFSVQIPNGLTSDAASSPTTDTATTQLSHFHLPNGPNASPVGFGGGVAAPAPSPSAGGPGAAAAGTADEPIELD